MAQDREISVDRVLGNLSSVEVTADTGQLATLHAITKQSDDAAPAVLAISCHRRTDSTPSEYLAVQDHAARTDDRYGVEIGFCDALVNAVAQRNRTKVR